jgi:hypothetical protein
LGSVGGGTLVLLAQMLALVAPVLPEPEDWA